MFFRGVKEKGRVGEKKRQNDSHFIYVDMWVTFWLFIKHGCGKKNFSTSSSNDIHLKSAYSNLFTHTSNPLFIKDQKDMM